jgi:arabinose-5-phosphate isomerase
MPLVNESTALADALVVMSAKGLGMTLILDSAGTLAGIFTDGDLRRHLDQGAELSTPMQQLMTGNCTVAEPDMLAAEALRLMETRHINALPVVEDGRPVGAFNMHDLLQAGVV